MGWNLDRLIEMIIQSVVACSYSCYPMLHCIAIGVLVRSNCLQAYSLLVPDIPRRIRIGEPSFSETVVGCFSFLPLTGKRRTSEGNPSACTREFREGNTNNRVEESVQSHSYE
ncbi:hypothetical protein AKJ16_DCAP25426 [Drosera capensis]